MLWGAAIHLAATATRASDWDWPAIIGTALTVAAATAACVAAIASWVSITSQKETHRATLITDLVKWYKSPEMNSAMAKAACSLKQRLEGNPGNLVPEIDTVASFFDLVGAFVRKDHLDKKLAWQTFGYDARRYFHALTIVRKPMAIKTAESWRSAGLMPKEVCDEVKQKGSLSLLVLARAFDRSSLEDFEAFADDCRTFEKANETVDTEPHLDVMTRVWLANLAS
jgi:hypothetical protein